MAAPADEVGALIEKGNSAAAYALGKKHPDQLGIPAFDFYFGVAAVDSGHAGEGVLALERYVVNFPGNRRAFIGKWSPMLTLSGGYSVEDNRAGRDDLGRDIYALRIGISGSPAPRWSVGTGLGIQWSDYSAQDVLFSTTRRDSYLSADIAVGYAVNRNLSLRGELLLSSNRSNIDLYDYRRDVIAAKVRYEFK